FAVLRGSAAGPLPGQALVVLEPELGLVTQSVGCEDGHAQEGSLLAPVLAAVQDQDVYLADRNFCTLGFLFGVAERRGFFVLRQHASDFSDGQGSAAGPPRGGAAAVLSEAHHRSGCGLLPARRGRGPRVDGA